MNNIFTFLILVQNYFSVHCPFLSLLLHPCSFYFVSAFYLISHPFLLSSFGPFPFFFIMHPFFICSPSISLIVCYSFFKIGFPFETWFNEQFLRHQIHSFTCPWRSYTKGWSVCRLYHHHCTTLIGYESTNQTTSRNDWRSLTDWKGILYLSLVFLNFSLSGESTTLSKETL